MHSGLTRVVWELNPVTKTSGGTRFFTGSHKSAYIRPAELNTPDSGAFDTYECPAGSAIIFTEVTVPHSAEPFCTARFFRVSQARPCSTCARSQALCHSAHPWTDKVDRLALFTCFDTGPHRPPSSGLRPCPTAFASRFSSPA